MISVGGCGVGEDGFFASSRFCVGSVVFAEAAMKLIRFLIVGDGGWEYYGEGSCKIVPSVGWCLWLRSMRD